MNEYNTSVSKLNKKSLFRLTDALDKDKQVNPYYFSFQKANPVFLRSTLEIWNNLGIKLHNVNIFETKKDFYISKMKKYSNIVSDYIDDRIVYTHPGNITIQFSPSFIFYFLDSPYLQGLGIRMNDSDEIEPVYSKIKLSKYNKYVTACYYNHEIAHTQSRFDNKESSLNEEVIPMMFEELSANNIDKSGRLLKEIRLLRLSALSENLDDLMYHGEKLSLKDAEETIGYIQSTLEAISLMNIYLSSDNYKKREMCNFINDIFAYKKSVQDMLDFYNCNVDEVSTNIKTLKRTRYK